MAVLFLNGRSLRRNLLIDLGANCGNSFQTLADQFGGFDRYYLWELNPLLFPRLKEIARQNEKVTFLPYGAWYEHTTVKMDIVGVDQKECDPSSSFWDGTTFVETNVVNKSDERFHSTVNAETRDFITWYKQTICLEDKVSLKMDIEKAEYAVLSNMIVYGLICHPQRLIAEFHPTVEPLKANQHLTQWSVDEESRKTCFESGFISTLEYVIQFCKNEPELVRWD
eukprot:TRINITY_DN17933_c1_g1_i2.p2 TRINITY_DN17933_c1_g1~~TRINITY_DN17933_c1_g1_i2.p2  ORF type:complete len:225 (-),score=16.77 TRINITY_DN17933_c1_g1_i2:154-828(-)